MAEESMGLIRRRRQSNAAANLAGKGAEAAADHDGSIDLGVLPQLVGYAVRRAQLRIFQDFIETMAEVDIRPGQFSVLTVIAANRGLKQAEVCEALGFKRANLVVMLDELERRGLVKRVRGASDRRSRALHLTKAGEVLLLRLNGLVAQHERRFIRRIGEDGKRQLLGLLAKLIAV